MSRYHPASQTWGYDQDICTSSTYLRNFNDRKEVGAGPSVAYRNHSLLKSVVDIAWTILANRRWYWILYMLLAWELRRLTWTLWWKAPVR